MDSRSRMFPYPILREQCIDYNNSIIKSNLLYDSIGNNIELKVEFIVNNDEIKKMIEEKVLSYALHIECGTTSFRKLYCNFNEVFNIEIPYSKLCNKVEVSCFIVANSNLSEFKIMDFNKDYEGLSFNLDKGSIIAIGNVWSLDINKDKDELGKLPSIFSVVMKKDLDRDFEININQDKIKILLSEENFINYKRLSKNKKNEPLIHSLIVLPALINVFNELILSEGEGYDHRWKIGLEKSLEKYKIDINNIERLKSEGAVRLSQLILEMPLKRTFENIIVNEGEDE